MNFFQLLSAAIAKQFHDFIHKPAREWMGEDVRRWLLEMERRSYSGFSPLDVPPPRRVVPFVNERRIA